MSEEVVSQANKERYDTYRKMFVWSVANGVVFKVDHDGVHTVLRAALDDIYSEIQLDTPETRDTIDNRIAYLIYCVKSGIEHNEKIKDEE